MKAMFLLLVAGLLPCINAHIRKDALPHLDDGGMSNFLRMDADSLGTGRIDSMGQAPETSPLKMFWGTSTWPKQGFERRPPLAAPFEKPGTMSQLVPGISMLMFALMSAIGFRYFSKSASETLPQQSSDPSQQPLLQTNKSLKFRFWTHLHALSCAIMWRHLQRRAIFIHCLRVGIPVVLLLVMHGLRDFFASQLKSAEGKLLTPSQTFEVSAGLGEVVLTVAVLYVSLMSMMFFVWHLNAESDSGLRHLLHVSGVSRAVYMLATIGVDGFCFITVELFFMVAVAGTWLQVRMVLWSAPSLLLLSMIGVITSTLMIGYLLHLSAPSAKLASMFAQFIVALCTLQAPLAPLQNVVPIAGQQSWISIIIPVIPAYRSLFELASGCMRGRCLTFDDVVLSFKEGEFVGPYKMFAGTSELVELSPPGAMVSFMLFNLCQLLVGWAVVILLDLRIRPALRTTRASPSKERASGEAALEVTCLSHQYGWLHGMIPGENAQILNGISFSVNRGTVLGLLGPNGAGKTTCIRCITGEESPLGGTAAINADTSSNGAHIGLCPQETVVNGGLTVVQNLTFFAYIRGCTAKDVERTLEHFLLASSLKDKRDCLPDTLSGGMKRRLAIACSLIGAPAVAILDEPTTGLDPLSRRGIWKTINETKLGGSCCLMTTHMLEEAEALCSRLVVLKKGVVAASGSVQQLKEEWGTGYMLSIESNAGQQDAARQFLASRVLKEDFELIKDTSAGQMTFRLRMGEEALGHLIIAIARERESNGIRHWGISQASLEDTYLKIIESALDAEACA